VPLWHLDVRALGYTPWSPRGESVEGGTGIGQICFPSDGQLVVTFISQVLPVTLPRRGQPEASSNLRLEALFVDARRGQLWTKHEWPTFSDLARIAPAGDGKFLVITPDKLTLYSPGIQPLKQLDLDVGREATPGSWGVGSSPGGRYLLIHYGPRSNEDNPRGFLGAVTRLELIDTEALRLVHTWTDHGFGDIHPFDLFDDGNILAINGTGGVTVVGPPGGPWRSFQVPWRSRCRPGGKTLINDRAIFGTTTVSTDRRCYSLTLTTGEILFAQEFADKEIVRWLAVSPGGRRFAIAVDKGRGGSWGLDIPARYSVDRVTVYDIPSRQWIFALSGKKQGIKSISGLALSPDGSLLGLINQDGILEVYRIPEGSGPTQPGQ
jgi:hypothetical protein